MKIRKATVDDYPAALALYEGFASNRLLEHRPGESQHWPVVIDHPGTSVFLAEQNGEIIGMATLHIPPNMTRGGRPYALIENVIMAADHRCGGVGRRVMKEVVAAAWSAGAYKIMLLTGKHRADGGYAAFTKSSASQLMKNSG